MPTLPVRLPGHAAILSLALSMPADLCAAPPETGPAPPAPRQSSPAPTRTDLNRSWSRADLDDAELAGLPRGSRMAMLDWERAYTLALIRGRAGHRIREPALAESLDPTALAEQAARYDVGDFARFREEFLASHPDDGEREGRFRDPSGEMLDLLKRRQGVELARKDIAAFENMTKVLQELIEKVSSGLSQLQLDQVSEALQVARLRLLDERGRYRDQLDALKVHLGLSAHARIAPDKGGFAAFGDVFDEAERWGGDPDLGPADLPRIVARLPAFEDLAIDGHSVNAIFDVYERAGSQPPQEEELLLAGTRVALENRAREGEGARLELKVRAALRRLFWIRLAYQVERRRFVLVAREKVQAQEQLFAPPRREETHPQRADVVSELIRLQGKILENQGRLVALWTEYQALRLGLYRDLGVLPYADWKSFYGQFAARPGAGQRP